MGYRKITNLYKRIDYLDLFRKAYVLEKIHGTSAHIHLSPEGVRLFSGGAQHSLFDLLFDKNKLLEIYKAEDHFNGKDITLYGEAYGGSMQGMSETYGKELRFIVFDVLMDDHWVEVPYAESVAKQFGQEFVWYELVDNTLENLDRYKNQPSKLAEIRGCGTDKLSEGIVSKPVYECYDKHGGRHMVKHKHEKFGETKTPREVSGLKQVILDNARDIAEEWVTKMRLHHLLDKTVITGMEDMKLLISAMQEDIREESEGEIDWTAAKEILSAIAKKTVLLYKEYLNESLDRHS